MGFFEAVDAYLGPLPSHLSHRAMRHSAIASNIANVDTPGYKAVDVKFADALKSAMGNGNGLAMTTTNARHLGAAAPAPLGGHEAYLLNGTPRRDGNDVNIDHEMVKMAENQIEYQFLAKRINGKFAKLREAITGKAQ